MTVAERKLELTRARLAVVSSLASLFQQQTTVLAQLLRVLEAKHGPIARSLEFRATEAALAAQRQQAEAEIALGMARRDTYTPETAQALANYAAHLRDAKSRLSESIRALLVQLEEFGVVIDDEGDEGRTDKHAEGIEETTTALGGNK
ncbi:uncharacterized protein CTHT_0000610 [Thermochaetoides thermophila DSM 1495]|uniref:Uncharacterized protein n=1 Tax=Chaetomium thermophilum (strain DSM 1495 / CBS 144.50 / IMI 039719) TaxID=759272 RepID=G0RYU5_CHATD|nr:hypothetical protein CTHT_0000610 [Thermochaetoides thermophila DSM 1495]EGS23373.1 hypothetical protein CTHT_0000610 [Thermochaetoides thermophila DSM 1495]